MGDWEKQALGPVAFSHFWRCGCHDLGKKKAWKT